MPKDVKRFTSRTAALTYQTCKRKRFLANHYGGHGLSPEAIDLFLETGTAIHRGLQNLLDHCRLEHPDGSFEEQCVNNSVRIALELFRQDISKASIALRETEQGSAHLIVAEHECLIEGLIRAFAINRLPSLLQQYEILSVEKDEIFFEFSDIVGWQSKADAEFLAFSDNTDTSNIWEHNKIPLGVVVCSIKTASEYAENTIRNLLTDMQGYSEWASVQARLLREFALFEKFFKDSSIEEIVAAGYSIGYAKYYSWCLKNNQKPKVHAVQYEHLITGSWKDDEKSGVRRRKSFLVHPYKFSRMSTMSVFSNTVSTTPTNYKWKVGAGKQPKGWERINIWEDIGINNWLNMLATGQVQAEEGNPLDELIKTSDPIFRDLDNGSKLQEWYESTKYQEELIVQHLEELERVAVIGRQTGDWKPYNLRLNQYFPKETLTCWSYYGHHCSFVKTCHEGYTLSDLIAGNVYVPRQPHHEPEKLYFIERRYNKK